MNFKTKNLKYNNEVNDTKPTAKSINNYIDKDRTKTQQLTWGRPIFLLKVRKNLNQSHFANMFTYQEM